MEVRFYEIAAGIQKGAAAHHLRRVSVHCRDVGSVCSADLVGWVVFDYRVLLGGIIGALVAIGNFAGICFVVQKVIDEPDEKSVKRSCRYPIIQGCCCRRCGSS